MRWQDIWVRWNRWDLNDDEFLLLAASIGKAQLALSIVTEFNERGGVHAYDPLHDPDGEQTPCPSC